MPTKRGTEGKVAGTDSDRLFHEPILGPDTLPPDLLERVRAQVQAAGLDPSGVVR